MEDTVKRIGPGRGGLFEGFAAPDAGASGYVAKLYFQDFVRLQLGNEGSAKWFVISDPNLWRVEFHMVKIGLKETDWNEDTDDSGDITARYVLETDADFQNVPEWRRHEW